jgi:hypothetical protein
MQSADEKSRDPHGLQSSTSFVLCVLTMTHTFSFVVALRRQDRDFIHPQSRARCHEITDRPTSLHLIQRTGNEIQG